MGKKNRQITIDDELNDELEKINASKLINDLLQDYFNRNKSDDLKVLNQKLEEKLQKKKILMREIRDLKLKINQIRDKEARVLRIFNKIPKEVVENINSYPNITLTSLRMRYNNIYQEKYNFTWLDLKQAFEEIRK